LTIGFYVFIVISVIEGEDLPSKPSAAGFVVPASGLIVEDILGERKI
jgi:hypothetical protein